MCDPVSLDPLAFFDDSYHASRQSFLAKCERSRTTRPGAGLYSLPVRSTRGEDLTIDALHLPPSGAPEDAPLLILSSGLHGVEGFAGAAFQRLVLDSLLDDFPECGVLLLHALNPFGFQHRRRVTEENIDLNRNFDVSDRLFATENGGYRKLAGVLGPGQAVSASDLDPLAFMRAAAEWSQRFSPRELREAVVRGQYEYADGIYFGGHGFAEQRGLIEPLLKSTMEPYREVLAVDLHTGFGARGVVHLFPDVRPEDTATRGRILELFAGHRIDWSDADDFYTTTGEFVSYIGMLARAEQVFTPMIFEYGTMDSHLPEGGLLAVHNMILENQGMQRGYASDAVRAEVEARFLEMFLPADPDWRASVLDRSLTILRGALERLMA